MRLVSRLNVIKTVLFCCFAANGTAKDVTDGARGNTSVRVRNGPLTYKRSDEVRYDAENAVGLNVSKALEAWENPVVVIPANEVIATDGKVERLPPTPAQPPALDFETSALVDFKHNALSASHKDHQQNKADLTSSKSESLVPSSDIVAQSKNVLNDAAGAAAAAAALAAIVKSPIPSLPRPSMDLTVPTIKPPKLNIGYPNLSLPPKLSIDYPNLSFPAGSISFPKVPLSKMPAAAAAALSSIPSPVELIRSNPYNLRIPSVPNVPAAIASTAPAVSNALRSLPEKIVGKADPKALITAAQHTAAIVAAQMALTALLGIKSNEASKKNEYRRQTQPPMIEFELKKLRSEEPPAFGEIPDSASVIQNEKNRGAEQIKELEKEIEELRSDEVRLLTDREAWTPDLVPMTTKQARSPEISLADKTLETAALVAPALISKRYFPTITQHYNAALQLRAPSSVANMERTDKLILGTEEGIDEKLPHQSWPSEMYEERANGLNGVLSKAIRRTNAPHSGIKGDD